jgi:hypothetical protein
VAPRPRRRREVLGWQTLAHIIDGHDSRRDAGYSDAELVYVARMGEGWKTDLEGDRVPLVGFGVLRDETR